MNQPVDPLTRDTGALRVIPGSHRVGEAYSDGLEQHIRESAEAWGISGRQVPALALETTPADLVVFDFRLKHGAFGGSQRRRMCTINVSRRYPEERLAELPRCSRRRRVVFSNMARRSGAPTVRP